MSLRYRMTQGVRALFAFTQSVEYDLAEQYLNSEMLLAFQQLRPNEQLHSLRVLRSVLAQEERTPHDLAVAALMHDIGKIRYPVGVLGKTLVVVVRKVLPPVYSRISHENPNNPWARPFVVAECHAKWSAEILRDCGAPERAIWLAEHHQESVSGWMQHPNAALLWRLQQADDTN